jgi:hypothetical protein
MNLSVPYKQGISFLIGWVPFDFLRKTLQLAVNYLRYKKVERLGGELLWSRLKRPPFLHKHSKVSESVYFQVKRICKKNMNLQHFRFSSFEVIKMHTSMFSKIDCTERVRIALTCLNCIRVALYSSPGLRISSADSNFHGFPKSFQVNVGLADYLPINHEWLLSDTSLLIIYGHLTYNSTLCNLYY